MDTGADVGVNSSAKSNPSSDPLYPSGESWGTVTSLCCDADPNRIYAGKGKWEMRSVMREACQPIEEREHTGAKSMSACELDHSVGRSTQVLELKDARLN